MKQTRGFLGQAIEWLESGEKSAPEVLEFCLTRIREREPALRAWVEVAPQAAMNGGPLAGVPFGVKDIFEARGLATEYGSPVYAGRKGEADARLVADLRRRGGIMLGKTQTTAFAYFDPAPTRNPRDERRTPGGSSSGSAAAVAARMVPFALGTQTMGSVIRPASFCGIAGFKPTYGVLPLEGVMPFAPSLDTAGLFTETAADMRMLWERMGYTVGGEAVRRLGVLDGWVPVEEGMRHSLDRTIERLRASGFRAEPVPLPVDFGALRAAVETISAVEGARTHRARWEEFGERIGAKMAGLVRRGLGTSETEYRDALGLVESARWLMRRVFEEWPVLVSPAARGAAPEGLASTGDPALNAPWTGLGGPVVTIPMPVSEGPPLGLQMAAAGGGDAMLLEAAVEAEALLFPRSRPQQL